MEKHISLVEKKKQFEALEAWREMDKKSVDNKDLYEKEIGEIEESGRKKEFLKNKNE
jgi:hypothetical protein